jgi:integrase
VRTFLDHLVRERHSSRAALGVYVAALHFLSRVTLDRPDVVQRIRYPRRGSERLPEILSPAEVERLLAAVRSLKHRAMLLVAYGAGLRASELCALTATDIDSERMLIRVRAGKGDKDRYVMLSDRLLATLRAYWRQRPPQGPYLFPRPGPGGSSCPAKRSGTSCAGRRGRRSSQAGDAPRVAPQRRHPSARSGHRHPGDPGAARPPLAAHDGALRPGLPRPRRHGDDSGRSPASVTTAASTCRWPPWARRHGHDDAATGLMAAMPVGTSWAADIGPAGT